MRTTLARRFSRADFYRLLASFLLAVLLWGWVGATQDPRIERTYSAVTVSAAGIPDGLSLVSALPTVDIRVDGPRSIMSRVNAIDVEPRLDFRSVTRPGDYTLPIRVVTPDGVWHAAATPGSVDVTIEERVSAQFPLVPSMQTVLAANRRVTSIDTEVSQVTVSGPRSLVTSIREVVLPITVQAVGAEFSGSFIPQAIDDTGRIIPEVTITPGEVAATVRIDERGKSVAVVTQIVGAPAEGYQVVDRAAIPNTILVDGPDDVLADLIAVTTAPVDVTGASASIGRRVSIVDLPAGVTVIDPPDGVVDVFVQITQQGVRQTLPAQGLIVDNLDPAYTVTLEPAQIAVTILASEDDMAGMVATDIEVHVDVAGLEPGTHRIQPRVVLPPNVQWVASDPSVVVVTIVDTAAAPASPTRGVTPTP
jgi:YbbR domain-containing protein